MTETDSILRNVVRLLIKDRQWIKSKKYVILTTYTRWFRSPYTPARTCVQRAHCPSAAQMVEWR